MLSEDGLRVRANQEHSIAGVDLQLDKRTPPDALYHGTIAAFLESIRQNGLEKRSPHHVHLSGDEATVIKVGVRRGKPVILRVAAGTVYRDVHQFYLSANGVWLVDAVPPSYFVFPDGR